MNLTTPINATVLDAQGAGILTNDDTPPTIIIDDPNGGNVGLSEVAEGNPPDTNQLTFSVSLSNLSYQDIGFTYSTQDGTATLLDNDYTQVVSGTFTILAGNSSGTFTVDVTADNTPELDESISIDLEKTSGLVTGADIFTLIGVGMILDDEGAPVVSIDDNNGTNNPGDAEIVEGNPSDTNQLTFSVTLSSLSAQDIVFTYSTSDGTALLSDTDYTQATNQTFTILAGATTGFFTIDVTADTKFEIGETVNVTLDVTSGTVAGATTFTLQGLILNDDAAPTISIDDVTVNENAGTATFTVTRTGETALDVGFKVDTGDDTATQPSDYTQITSGAHTILAGGATNTTTFDVTIIDDGVYELTETYFANLTIDVPANVNLVGNDLQGLGTITNEDAAPTISIDDVTVNENAGTATFTVTRTGETALDVGFKVDTGDDTATQPSDYTQITSGAHTILAGGATNTTTFDVTIIDDGVYELTETYFANLTIDVPANVNLVGSDLQGLGTITNEDAAPTIIIDDSNGANVGLSQITEGNPPDTNQLTFSVSLSNLSYENIVFTYSTQDGTATLLDNDYTQVVGGTFTILAGTSSGTFTVDVTADNTPELDESISIDLEKTSGLVTGVDTFTLVDVGIILDDEGGPVVYINDNNGNNLGDAEIVEGNPSDTNQLTFGVTLSSPSAQDIEFAYSTSDGTALFSDTDYTPATNQTFTILAGATTGSFTIDVTADTKFEIDETVNVTLNVTSGAVSGATTFTLQGVILNDDAAPTISIDDVTVNENAGTATFTVTRTGETALDVGFKVDTGDDTATQPSDYTQITSGAHTILAGGATNTTTFDVTIIDDGVYELTETYFANLTIDVPANVNLVGSDLQGLGIITNDDVAPTVTDNDNSGGNFVIPPEEYEPNNPPFVSLPEPFYPIDSPEIAQLQPFTTAPPPAFFSPFGWNIDVIDPIQEYEPRIVVSTFTGEGKAGELEGYFSIFITEKPEKPLIIELDSEGISEGGITPRIVTFTPENWDQPQVVIIDDKNWNPEKASEIITTKVEAGDVYQNIDAPDVKIPATDENTKVKVGNVYQNNDAPDVNLPVTDGNSKGGVEGGVEASK